MGRKTMIGCLTFAAMLLACERAPEERLTAPVRPRLAYVVHERDVPYQRWIASSCPGSEWVWVEGVVRFMVVMGDSLKPGPGHNNQISVAHMTGTGVGRESGTTYRVAEAQLHSMNRMSAGDYPPQEYTGIWRTRVVSLDTMPSFSEWLLVHGTMNAEGTITASFTHQRTDCD